MKDQHALARSKKEKQEIVAKAPAIQLWAY